MLKASPVIVGYNAVTPYGEGIDVCWQGLLSNQTSIDDIKRFDTSHFKSSKAATIKDLVPGKGKSFVFQMLERLKKNINNPMPEDADLILASLNGEIDFLEDEILTGKKGLEESRLGLLLAKAHDLFKVKGRGMVISAACASSSVAIARAASLIRSKKSDCVLVVSCDCVSEFVISGFSSLMALDKQSARPFDKNREGLNVGEAAAYILLMSKERADKEKRAVKGSISGWGISCDANHVTGPSIGGEGLFLAINRALESGGMAAEEINSICAHGTGTVYNDSMEMKAFKNIFGEKVLPTYSIKGGIGHTMGSAGLMDALVVLETIQSNVLPPTVGTENVDEEAAGWIKKEEVRLENDVVLSTNSGFGGINSALIIGL
ncbi:MAG: beta-ketoacyl synthase N-terminal-like domain-containing protein [Candidatus Aceula meridiana]|nr:beta-ketoacyl synthase N-terminal-like domain-containing protein [Candidatus Aceula meridiana]